MKFSNVLVASVLMAGLISLPAHATNPKDAECPVNLLPKKDASGNIYYLTLDQEFGPGTQDLTRCIVQREEVKMVVQINQFTDSSGRPYGLANIANIIDDYEITHGMKAGKDYKIVAVLHSPGGRMALKDIGLNSAGVSVSGRNPYEKQVTDLMDRGVKFYFCQNTTRAYLGQPSTSITSLPAGNATAQIIPGIEYTTAGLTSIADFQALGYQYIQP